MSQTKTKKTKSYYEKRANRPWRRMPTVHQGDTVLWYDGGSIDSLPTLALVINVGECAIDLSLIAPSCADLLTRSGVKHVDDPTRTPISNQEVGCWDYSEPTKRALRMQEGLYDLLVELGRAELASTLLGLEPEPEEAK